MPEMNVFIGPYFSIKFSNIAFAIVFALLFTTGMSTRYFVKSHISVTMYSLPYSIFFLFYSFVGVSVLVIGVFVCVVVFDIWHL